MENSDFKLSVQSREGKVYEGEVKSISSKNEKGIFDILGRHANFISLIFGGLDVVDKKGQSYKINFDIALIRVLGNEAEVFLGVEAIGSNSQY